MAPFQPQGGHFGLILPLCSSSATVGLALFQYPVMGSFLYSRPSTAGPSFSAWWASFLPGGVTVVTAACATSALGGILSARWLRSHTTLETSDVAKWYTYGALFAAGHFLFFPLVGAPIKKIIDAGKVALEQIDGADGNGSGLFMRPVAHADEVDVMAVDRSNREQMKTWFLWHTLRTFVVDLPALWCFAEGAALSFWVISD